MISDEVSSVVIDINDNSIIMDSDHVGSGLEDIVPHQQNDQKSSSENGIIELLRFPHVYQGSVNEACAQISIVNPRKITKNEENISNQNGANNNLTPKKRKKKNKANTSTKQSEANATLFQAETLLKPKKYPIAAANIFSSIQSVMEITETLMKLAQQGSKESSKVWHCIKDLKSIDINLMVYPTGSRVLGLADTSSDLDIFLDIGNMYYGTDYQDAHSQSDFVFMLEKKLSKNRKIWTQTFPLPSARTPIVRTLHIPTNLKCDISLRHGLAHENTCYLREMFDIQPAIVPFILLLKDWLSKAQLTYLRNFTLTVMVLFYFQLRKYLPPIALLRTFSPYPKIVAGWECQYTIDTSVVKVLYLPLNLIDLAYGFFQYYSDVFNYNTQVVCPLLGRPVLKSQFENNGALLPSEMWTYKEMVSQITDEERKRSQVSAYVMDHPNKDVFRIDSPMCIQDPFDLSHNLSKAIDDKFLDKFKRFCNFEAEKCLKLRSQIDPTTFKDKFCSQ